MARDAQEVADGLLVTRGRERSTAEDTKWGRIAGKVIIDDCQLEGSKRGRQK